MSLLLLSLLLLGRRDTEETTSLTVATDPRTNILITVFLGICVATGGGVSLSLLPSSLSEKESVDWRATVSHARACRKRERARKSLLTVTSQRREE